MLMIVFLVIMVLHVDGSIPGDDGLHVDDCFPGDDGLHVDDSFPGDDGFTCWW